MPLLRRPSPAPRARRALALATVLAATTTLAACTGNAEDSADDFTGAKGEVQDLIQKFSDRADRGDAADICRELLGAELRATFEQGGSCNDNVTAAIQAADYTGLDVVEVRLGAGAENATTAAALIRPIESDTARRQITVEREAKGQPWTITAFVPKPAKAAATTPAGTSPASTTPATTPEG